jgi:spore coat protein CotF
MIKVLDEKDRLQDSLVTQKYIAHGYNSAATEAANPQLMDTFINILRDEHQIQKEIFNEMRIRGWYQPKEANTNDIRQSFSKWSQELQRVQNKAIQTSAQQARPQQTGAQPPSYQTGIPHYGFQTGVGMPQQPNDIQQQNLYRSPQNPMI